MMSFSMFVVLMGLIVGSVAFFHFTQGFFTATISAILAVFAAVLAVGYHEWVVESFLGGAASDIAHAGVLAVMFAGIYLVLRLVFDQYVPGGAQVPAVVDKAGGALMGVVAGLFAAGVCAVVAQSLPLNPAILGYSRFAVEGTGSITVPQARGRRTLTRAAYDILNEGDKALNEVGDEQRQMMLLPADDILVSTVKRVSEVGALSTDKPLSSVHPDWLGELFAQRLGIQPAGKRVAVNTPDNKQVDVICSSKDAAFPDSGVYVVDRPMPQQLGDFSSILRKTVEGPFGDPKRMGRGQVGVIVRIYFGPKAKDTRDNLIRLGLSSTRLVARRPGPSGELEPYNYYPLGTVEDGKTVWHQRADDYLFIDDGSNAGPSSDAPPATAETAKETVTRKGIDLVFVVDANGFLQDPRAGADPKAAAASKVAAGTFVEVKRMGRVDLSDEQVRPASKLPRRLAVAVMRKTLVKTPEKEPEDPSLADRPLSAEEMAPLLLGSWEAAAPDNGQVALSITEGGFTWAERRNGQVGVSIEGNYRTGPLVDGTKLPLTVSGKSGGQDYRDVLYVQMQRSNDQSMLMTDKEGKGVAYSFTRKGGARPTPAPSTPTTPAPAPAPTTTTPPAAAPPPAAQAAPKDTSLRVVDAVQNNKFREQINVLAGTNGDMAIGSGTITVTDNQLAMIDLPSMRPEGLKGQGEPINRLAVPAGKLCLQVEAVAGPDGGGWAWKDRVRQTVAVDEQGGRHPIVGVWFTSENEKSLVAKYKPGGEVSMAEFIPVVGFKPDKVFLVFHIPEAARVKEIQIGQATLHAFAPSVP